MQCILNYEKVQEALHEIYFMFREFLTKRSLIVIKTKTRQPQSVFEAITFNIVNPINPRKAINL